ncbi:MAG TPA: GPO family capsid scaffolding protein [Sphingomonas sp.]|nr:GPO family capsid scaffolding protein [Sphingomonas sp.]
MPDCAGTDTRTEGQPNMGTKSKFFRAFVEGQTISDNRTVTAEMVDDIVATFNLQTYTPRINVEHIAGYSPEPPFNGYGDVIAVKAQTDDVTIDGKTEKRRALYCQVDGNDQLVALSERDQKPFPSVELTPNYAGTGKVGLVGLAFTDTPASIATQRLQFARVNGNLAFTATDRAALEFEVAPDNPSAGPIAAMTGFFSKLGALLPTAPTPPAQTNNTPDPAPQPPANDNFAKLTEGMGLIAKSITALDTKFSGQVSSLTKEFGTIKSKLESTEALSGFSRQPAPGGSNAIVTDC